MIFAPHLLFLPAELYVLYIPLLNFKEECLQIKNVTAMQKSETKREQEDYDKFIAKMKRGEVTEKDVDLLLGEDEK